MGKLFWYFGLGVLGLTWSVPPSEAGSLGLAGVVERTMAADLSIDPFTQILRIRNSGNESFRVEVSSLEHALDLRNKSALGSQVEEQNLPPQLGIYLASVIPAQMQRDLNLKSGPVLSGKNTVNVSILAP